MRKLAVFFGLVLGSAGLAGCGPVYQTVYNYEPPRDEIGMRCVRQCEDTMRECLQKEELKDENCRKEYHIADLEYQRCRELARQRGEKPERCYRRGVYCSSGDRERCESQYRLCYENCGGVIRSKQVCSMFCD